MNKEFVPYPEAVAMKELGFDEECMGCFMIDFHKHLCHVLNFNNADDYIKTSNSGRKPRSYIKAPLWQQAFDWFEKKYNLEGLVSKHFQHSQKISEVEEFFYIWNISDFNKRRQMGEIGNQCIKSGSELKHEEAKLTCLKKLIEIVKDK